jgi:hypothetical protein
MTKEADNGFTLREWLKQEKEEQNAEALREDRRKRKLQPTCPDCDSDNVHITVMTSQGWDIETGDWRWDEPFCTDGPVICGDCEKEIRPVFKPNTETSA